LGQRGAWLVIARKSFSSTGRPRIASLRPADAVADTHLPVHLHQWIVSFGQTQQAEQIRQRGNLSKLPNSMISIRLPLIFARPQTPNWAKRGRRRPVKPRRDPLSRDYLTREEVEAMVVAARRSGGRTADRDALLIMTAYRHGCVPPKSRECDRTRWTLRWAACTSPG